MYYIPMDLTQALQTIVTELSFMSSSYPFMVQVAFHFAQIIFCSYEI